MYNSRIGTSLAHYIGILDNLRTGRIMKVIPWSDLVMEITTPLIPPPPHTHKQSIGRAGSALHFHRDDGSFFLNRMISYFQRITMEQIMRSK